MMSFRFPVITFYGDEYDDYEITYHEGRISQANLSGVPYEATVFAFGKSFHLIFGYQSNGMFLCVPNANLGCELSRLTDVNWNLDAILDREQRVNYEEATALAYALCELGRLIK